MHKLSIPFFSAFIFAVSTLLPQGSAVAQQGNYWGQYSANPYVLKPSPRLPGTYTNPYGNDGNSPRLYDNRGNFRGNLNSNRYDPNSIANPYGRYGSRYSQDSINNPYGAGSRYRNDSPNNPYGSGLRIYGQ